MTSFSKALTYHDGGYNILGLNQSAIPLQQATRSKALWDLGERKPPPACRLYFARRRPLQQRFRSRERFGSAPCVEMILIYESRQERAIEIPLDDRAIGKHVLPLTQRLLGVSAADVVELGQARRARTEFGHAATRLRGLHLERGDERTSAANLRTASEVLLETPVADLLSSNIGALREDAVRQFTVRPLTFGLQPPFDFGASALPVLVPLRSRPTLRAFLRHAIRQVVVRVGGRGGSGPCRARSPAVPSMAVRPRGRRFPA